MKCVITKEITGFPGKIFGDELQMAKNRRYKSNNSLVLCNLGKSFSTLFVLTVAML